MFYTVTELYYWVRKIIAIQEANPKISKTVYDIALPFSAGLGVIFSDIGGEQGKQDLGVATYRDENHFQDYTFSVWFSIYPAQL